MLLLQQLLLLLLLLQVLFAVANTRIDMNELNKIALLAGYQCNLLVYLFSFCFYFQIHYSYYILLLFIYCFFSQAQQIPMNLTQTSSNYFYFYARTHRRYNRAYIDTYITIKSIANCVCVSLTEFQFLISNNNVN